jgi:hypothetical protein
MIQPNAQPESNGEGKVESCRERRWDVATEVQETFIRTHERLEHSSRQERQLKGDGIRTCP